MVTTLRELIEEPFAVRSAIEWTIDRHYVETDRDFGIVHDLNDWRRHVSDPPTSSARTPGSARCGCGRYGSSTRCLRLRWRSARAK